MKITANWRIFFFQVAIYRRFFCLSSRDESIVPVAEGRPKTLYAGCKEIMASGHVITGSDRHRSRNRAFDDCLEVRLTERIGPERRAWEIQRCCDEG